MIRAHDNLAKTKLINGQLHIDTILIDDGVDVHASTCPHFRDKKSFHSGEKIEAHVCFHILHHLTSTH